MGTLDTHSHQVGGWRLACHTPTSASVLGPEIGPPGRVWSCNISGMHVRTVMGEPDLRVTPDCDIIGSRTIAASALSTGRVLEQRLCVELR